MGTPPRRRGPSYMAPTPSPPRGQGRHPGLGLDGEAGVSFAHPGLPWPRDSARAPGYTSVVWSMKGRWDTTRVVSMTRRLRGKGWFSLLAKKKLESRAAAMRADACDSVTTKRGRKGKTGT